MELKSHKESFKKVLNQRYANKLRKQHQINIEHDFQRNDVGYDLLKCAFDSQLDNYDVFEVEAKLCVAGEQIKECATYLKLQCLLISQLISKGVNIISTIEEGHKAEIEIEIETEKSLDDGECGEKFREKNIESEEFQEEEINESKLKSKQNDEGLLIELDREKTGRLEGEEDGYIFLPYCRDDSYVLI